MVATMAKRKPPEEPPVKRYPSRDNIKYVALPLELWERLKGLADDEDRSVSWMVRKAVRELLDRQSSAGPADD